MIYQAILKIRGKEIPILYYNYRCHIQHHDDSNLRRIIQLHIQVCEEIGNRENLPVEGDLITLAFECSGDEAFFYDWLNEGMMQDGEIHFIYNEVEVADIFRFWDCYCVKIEEYMSVGSAPMMMVVYLSPGIIKRNNLEVREKVWKVSEISQQPIAPIASESKEEKQPEIVEVYWKDAEGNTILNELPEDEMVTLYARVINAKSGDKISFTIIDDDGNKIVCGEECDIDHNGIAIIKEFELQTYRKNIEMILNAQLKSTNQSMCHNINDTPQILHAYWADKDGKLIKFPSYNSRLVYICIITNKEAVGKDYDISFFHMANGKIEKVCMNIDNIVINSTKMLVPIPFDEKYLRQ
ncbi:type VI secretion system tube protein TssD [Bacteroides fragilis]